MSVNLFQSPLGHSVRCFGDPFTSMPIVNTLGCTSMNRHGQSSLSTDPSDDLRTSSSSSYLHVCYANQVSLQENFKA